ncbi:MAG: acyltransferase family protein [Rhizobiaceae bacterium]
MSDNGTRRRSKTDLPRRFVVLDSWRGLFALLVAAFHFPLSGPLSQTVFLRNSYLFVDFFFVLSGFVIAHAYGQKLSEGQGLGKFLITRFGRLAPLHLFILAVLVLLEILRVYLPAFSNGNPPFSGRNTVEGALINLFLLQGFGLTSELTWNTPSWSISTELCAYVAFGIAMTCFGRNGLKVMAALAMVCPFALWIWSPTLLDVTNGYAILRCLYGFAFGVMTYQIFIQRFADKGAVISPRTWSFCEAGTLLAIFGLIILGGNNSFSFFAPIIFAAAILVFVHEGGVISRLLRTRPFTMIGALSYSIYMVHMTVQAVLYAISHITHRYLGWNEIPKLETAGVEVYDLALWQDAAFLGLMLTLTVAASFMTYRFVELPANRWFRSLAQKLPDRTPQAIHLAE